MIDAIKELYVKRKYEVILFLILGFVFFRECPLSRFTSLHPFFKMQYYITYEFGFIARGLIGSVFKGIFPVDLYEEAINLFYLFFCIIISILFTIFTCKCIRKAGTLEETVFKIAVLVYLSPMAISYFFTGDEWGCFDIYVALIAILSCLIVICGKGLILIPILSAVMLLIHHGSFFTFFPIVIFLLFYESCIKKQYKNYAILGITILVGCIVFAYMQFFSQAVNISSDELIAIIESRAGQSFGDNTDYLERWYFKGNSLSISSLFSSRYFILFLTIVLYLPILTILKTFWTTLIRNCKTVRERICYVAMAFSFLTIIPSIVLTWDTGRWIIAVLIGQSVFIFFLVFRGDKNAIVSLESLREYFREKPQRYWILCIYVTILGMGSIEGATIACRVFGILDWVKKVAGVVVRSI